MRVSSQAFCQIQVLLNLSGSGDTTFELLGGYGALAFSLERLGRFDEARAYVERAHELSKTNLGADHYQTKVLKDILDSPTAIPRPAPNGGRRSID